jgi:glycosyltransferase involved in cell wall biosynthesis
VSESALSVSGSAAVPRLASTEAGEPWSAANAARIAFVFTQGRRVRREHGVETPSDHFYGYAELAARGWHVDLLEEPDLAVAHKTLIARAALHALPLPLGMNLVRVAAVASGRALERLNQYDIVVTTNQQLGSELSLLASLGLLTARIVMIVMGLLPLEPKGAMRAKGLGAVLRKTTVIAISRPEQQSIQRRLGPSIAVRYVPFGIDHRFWRPRSPGSGGYVLSVGNDQHRDFGLLARIWRPEWPRLRIITRLAVPATANNVEVIKGDYASRLITDVEMREMVQGALFSVVPLRESWQPSGQSVGLQSMACGIPLIISDTPGLWDRDVMRDGVTCLLARAGSAESMMAAIKTLLQSATLRARLGKAARAAVEEHFTADLMATELGNVLAELVHEER